MTTTNSKVQVERILSLPETIWIDAEESSPGIQAATHQSGTFWVLGRQVLLRSNDGLNWQDASHNLRDEGSFCVVSIAHEPACTKIFARSRNGLRCYRWDEWDRAWKPLFSVNTSSPGVFAAWTDDGLITIASESPSTAVECRNGDLSKSARWRTILLGNAIHVQLASSGIGLCALWGTSESPHESDRGPSAAYSTSDFGRSWRRIAEFDTTMLLVGTAINHNSAIVGGTSGLIASVANDKLREVWIEQGGDIVAIDANGTTQIAVIESEDQPAVQGLLLRQGDGTWVRYEANFERRVECMKLTCLGECIVCTSNEIYSCKFNLDELETRLTT